MSEVAPCFLSGVAKLVKPPLACKKNKYQQKADLTAKEIFPSRLVWIEPL
jgi:hypothetical protein